ncbi:hypothetical protein [Stenotrophomonas sp. Marseille-Q4652]|uniref:hypothetical protein n=1 Tax=Stenotrophomonas sp. Marseille-Q4652 TaxID=2866595 RepID=UPI001CE448ED|nr:hypothetical protein [Stenotrophomonas sp. Marseille-Q4652]
MVRRNLNSPVAGPRHQSSRVAAHAVTGASSISPAPDRKTIFCAAPSSSRRLKPVTYSSRAALNNAHAPQAASAADSVTTPKLTMVWRSRVYQ